LLLVEKMKLFIGLFIVVLLVKCVYSQCREFSCEIFNQIPCNTTFFACLNNTLIAEGTGELPLKFNGLVSQFSAAMGVPLKYAFIGEGITGISDSAFFRASELEEVSISSSVKFIADKAFSFTKLSNFVVPNGVEFIGSEAFKNCSVLQSVSIPESVTEIGHSAFASCPQLQTITIDPANQKFKYEDNALFSKDGTMLYEFRGSGSVYTAPDSVTGFGMYAFADNLDLVTVNAKSIEVIEDFAFKGCENLKNFNVDEGVSDRIGSFAFQGCLSLESAPLGDGLKSIGPSAFQACEKLNTVTMPNSVKIVGANSFMSCTSLKSLTLSKKLESIGPNAFFGCLNIEELKVPDALEEIGDWAFAMCTGLKSVSLSSDGLTDIGRSAFAGCNASESLTLSTPLKKIGAWAFSGWDSLKKVTIPKSVTKIDKQAFAGCSKLSTVVYAGKKDPSSSTDVFDSCPELKCVNISDSKYSSKKVCGMELCNPPEYDSETGSTIIPVLSFISLLCALIIF